MPSITIQSIELTEEQKSIIAEKFTRLLSQVSDVPEDRVNIYFQHYPLESMARAGRLFSKNPPKYVRD
jgi:phenylpyruvate tautomerase PptA (4-oxalocrotonate tautomerase family)